MSKIIGAILVSLPFIVITIEMVRTIGWLGALSVWLSVGVVFVLIWVGVSLMMK